MVKNSPVNTGNTSDLGVQSMGQEDSLEEEMAIHSSILAWNSPWTEEPGELQAMGSRKESDTTE